MNFLDKGSTPFTSTMLKMVKTSYGEVKKLSSPEAAYIAALIDGEGTITLTRHNNSEYRRLEVGISNTELKLIKWVKDLLGSGQIKFKRAHNKKCKICYTYRICNRQAFNVLIQILPYLQTYKRERAKLILKNYIRLTPRNGKYSSKIFNQRKKFIEAFFAIPGSNKIRKVDTCALI